MTLVFPSVEWMRALAELANEDEEFKKIGRLNAVVAFKVGADVYSVTFDVLSCRDVRAIGEAEMREADFVLEMQPETWEAMLSDIRAHGHASRDFTLNTLDLSGDEPIHRNVAGDGYRADKFFRYNPSLQRFFDNAARLDTVFERSKPASRA